MAKPFNDKKLGLGEPLATRLRDFCTANYGAPALAIIREALAEHMDRRLEEPAMRERYEKVRKARLNLPNKIAKLVSNGE